MHDNEKKNTRGNFIKEKNEKNSNLKRINNFF